MKSRVLLAAALLAVAGAVSAQQMPRMVEFYFDADASAMRPVLVLKDSGDTAVDRLMRKVERSPDAVLETAQLAHYAMASGRHDLGRDLYARALARMDQGSGLWRPVKWNLGWEALSRDNPKLVLVRISGYGQDGPYSARPGFAAIAEGMAGFRYITGFPDRPPARPNLSIGPMWPVATDRTAAWFDYFFAEGTDEAWIDEMIEFDNQVGAEDTGLVEAVQRGAASGALEHGRLLTRTEQLIGAFQDMVRTRLA